MWILTKTFTGLYLPQDVPCSYFVLTDSLGAVYYRLHDNTTSSDAYFAFPVGIKMIDPINVMAMAAQSRVLILSFSIVGLMAMGSLVTLGLYKMGLF